MTDTTTVTASAVERDDDRTWGLLVAVGAPILLGSLLVPLRSHIDASHAALALVVPVVIAAAIGGRVAGALAAMFAAASFDFFLTRPYLSLNMESSDDIGTAVLLAIVGVIVGTVAATNHRSREASSAYAEELDAVHRVAETLASGTADVVDAAARELQALLRLRSCHYEEGPIAEDLPSLNPHGTTGGTLATYVSRRRGLELPRDGVVLPVRTNGHTVGRFVLLPSPGVGVPKHARLAAVVIADHVGATLVATGA